MSYLQIARTGLPRHRWQPVGFIGGNEVPVGDRLTIGCQGLRKARMKLQSLWYASLARMGEVETHLAVSLCLEPGRCSGMVLSASLRRADLFAVYVESPVLTRNGH